MGEVPGQSRQNWLTQDVTSWGCSFLHFCASNAPSPIRSLIRIHIDLLGGTCLTNLETGASFLLM